MIDVIIPTYNRAESLQKVIDSYLSQELLEKIIIVDDCSTDTIADVVTKISEENPGKILYHRLDKKVSLPEVRNVGMHRATADYIFMGEDDVLLPKDHFRVLKEKMDFYGADIITGRRINMYKGQTMDQAKMLADADHNSAFVRVPFEAYFERYIETAQETYTLHSNVLMKRRVFEAVQYDPLYTGNAFREETDFFLRAYSAGFHLWLIPDTVSFHLKNMALNSSGGSRKMRIVYEWQVWKNTARLLLKNRVFFKKQFGVTYIYWYLFRCLIARYTYAFRRRIQQQKNQRKYETT